MISNLMLFTLLIGQLQDHTSPAYTNDMVMEYNVEKWVYDNTKKDGTTYFINRVLPYEQTLIFRSLNSNKYNERELASYLIIKNRYNPSIQRLVMWGSFNKGNPELQSRCMELLYQLYLCNKCNGTGICGVCNGTKVDPNGDSCDECEAFDRISQRYIRLKFSICKKCMGTGHPLDMEDK